MEGTTYSDVEDRISRLPDTLIHLIMFYIDTKYAVQTSVLSKRWIHIWKSLPFLNFNRSSFAENKQHSFIMLVHMVFIFRKEIDIQKFSVMDWENSAYDNTMIMNVNRWSNHAVKYNAREISIQCQLHNTAYEIPQRLLNCKSLTKLQIRAHSWIDIILPRSMSLPQLKKLYLYGLSISNVESSKRLFSSCSVLEALDMVDCNIQTDNQKKLIVDSVSLKQFTYTRWNRPQNNTMTNIISYVLQTWKHSLADLS